MDKGHKKDGLDRMRDFFGQEWVLVSILVLLCAFLFVFKLGDSPLWNNDETIYSEMAKEMIKLSDWITLHFNYQIQFDKPPLYFWLIALTFRLFGWNEFTARLWSSIFGIGGVVVVYFLGKNIFDRKTGFLAGLILATSLQYIAQSRLVTHDVTLSFFISLSLLFFYLGYKTSKGMYYLLFFLAAALATLTKGPIGAVLPFLIVGLWLGLTKQLRVLRGMRILLGIIIYLAVVSPWFIIQFLRHGEEFVNAFFLARHFSRYLAPFQGQSGPLYYYILVLFLGFYPWVGFLPSSAYHLVISKANWHSDEGKKSLLLLLWFGLIFTFFTFAQTKLPNYILPLYPSLALMVGKFWNDSFSRTLRHFRRFMFSSFFLFLFLSILFVLAVTAILKSNYPAEYAEYGRSLSFLAMVLASGTAISFLAFFWKKRPTLSFLSIVGMMCFFLGVLVVLILPKVDLSRPTKALSYKITSLIQPGEKIGMYLPPDPGLVYYSDHPVMEIHTKAEVFSFLRSEERVYCLMDEEHYLKLKEENSQIPLYILDKKRQKVIVSNKK